MPLLSCRGAHAVIADRVPSPRHTLESFTFFALVFRVPSPSPTPGAQGPGLSAKGLARTGRSVPTAGRGWDPLPAPGCTSSQEGRRPRREAPRACLCRLSQAVSGRVSMSPRTCPAPGSWLISAMFPISAGPATCGRQADECALYPREAGRESRMGTPERSRRERSGGAGGRRAHRWEAQRGAAGRAAGQGTAGGARASESPWAGPLVTVVIAGDRLRPEALSTSSASEQALPEPGSGTKAPRKHVPRCGPSGDSRTSHPDTAVVKPQHPIGLLGVCHAR